MLVEETTEVVIRSMLDPLAEPLPKLDVIANRISNLPRENRSDRERAVEPALLRPRCRK